MTASDERKLALRPLLLLAVWFAFSTGLAELLVWVVARWGVHRAVHFDPQLVWTAPAAHLAVFGVLALLLVLAWRTRPVPALAVLAVFCAAGLYSIALMVPRVHPLASLLLSLGVGVQLARMLSRHPQALLRRARRTLPLMAGLVLLLTCGVYGGEALREWRARRAQPAPDSTRPNVLFIIWDTVRAASTSLYGYDRQTTPFLQSLAAQGTVFDRAITAAPWTLASHGTLFTGHMPFELSADWETPLDGRWPTLAGYLSARGYATGGFVANYIYGPPAYGLARGFVHYRFYPLTFGVIATSAPLVQHLVRQANRWLGTYYVPGRRRASDIAREFLDWQATQQGRPFFAFLNFFDAHDPYAPEKPFDTRFGSPRVRRIATGRDPSPAERRDLIDGYDDAITSMDEQVRLLLEALRRRGVLEHTLVIISSDHGEELGEHRLWGHGNSLFIDELHVPLLVSFPGGVPGGVRVPGTVSLRDLPATIADLTGLADGAPFPGRSLTRFWRSPVDTTSESAVSVVPFSARQPDWYPIPRRATCAAPCAGPSI